MSERSLPGKLLRAAAFCVVVPLATLVLGECSVSVLGLDDQLVARSLYYQGSDLQAHQVSDTEGLLYELRPDTTFTSHAAWPEGDPVREDFGEENLDENGGRHYEVNINRHGVRGPAHPDAKGDGVFRVHFFGASTLYGAGVHDDETMAHYLEQALQAADPSRTYEVWNYGTSGYVLAQMAILSQRELADHDPDLIIVLHTNNGRRPFLEEQPKRTDYSEFFERSPELWRENFLPQCRQWPRDFTQWMPRSALVRAVTVAWVRDMIWTCPPDGDERRHLESRKLLETADAKGIGVIWVAAPGEPANQRDSVYLELPEDHFYSLQLHEQEPVFYDAHPTPRILKQHSERLAAELRARGLAPTPPAPPGDPSPEQESSPSP